MNSEQWRGVRVATQLGIEPRTSSFGEVASPNLNPDADPASAAETSSEVDRRSRQIGTDGVSPVAALFVEEGGAYYGLEGVDPWPESRDARLYRGPHPVVAHPPCGRWAMPLSKINQTRYGHRVGDDGGCFHAALFAVRQFGGVLEHPANSFAFCAFGISKPHRGQWCAVGTPLRMGWHAWVTEVSQSAYGCPARKRTWLYAVMPGDPPELDWSEPEPTHVTSWLQKTTTELPRLSKRAASRTPPAFRDVLLDIARRASSAPDRSGERKP